MANDNESEKYTNIDDIINALMIRDTTNWNDIINSIPDKLKDDPLVQTVIIIATTDDEYKLIDTMKNIADTSPKILLDNPELCTIATRKSKGAYGPPSELIEQAENSFVVDYLSWTPPNLYDAADIITETKDVEFMEEFLKNTQNGYFTNENMHMSVYKLVNAIANEKNEKVANVVNDILKSKNNYDLDDDELGRLVVSTDDKDFYEDVKDNLDKYNLNFTSFKFLPTPSNEYNLQNKHLPKDISFGIEIEFLGEFNDQLSEQGQYYGLNHHWIQKSETIYNDNTDRKGWSTEYASPTFNGNPNDIKNIYEVCSLLKACNCFTNDSCGGHIHIGSNCLKTTRSWINLIELWANTEGIMYAISNDKGDPPRKSIANYANPISQKIHDYIEDNDINLDDEEVTDDFLEKIIAIQNTASKSEFETAYKYYGINFNTIKYNNIEFRTPNGTLNPDTWIENINLFSGLVKSSYDLSQIQKKIENGINITDDEKKKLDAFNEITELENNEENNETKLHDLLDILFDDEEEKKIYSDRYEANKDYGINSDYKITKEQVQIKNKKIGQLAFTGEDGVTVGDYSIGNRIVNQQLEKDKVNECHDMTDRS